MEKDDLSDADAVNVLRGGVVREAAWENGSWRYRVETPKMAFVVTFDPEPAEIPNDDEEIENIELIVVTGWRKQRA